MAFTKVVGPGIHTQSNIVSHNINSSGIITATQFDGPFSNVVVGGATTLTVDGINISAGILTAQTLDLNGNGDISGNLVIGGNLTANGDFTTLNTTLREVELLRVDADASVAAGIITQRGSGDIFSAYDTSTEVFKIADGGAVSVLATGDNKGLRVHTNSGVSATNNELRFNTGQSSGFTFMANSDGSASNERLRITSAGILELDRGSAVDQAIDIKTTATTGASRIRFVESGTAKAQIAYSHANDQLEIIGATGNAVAFFAGGTQKATLTDDGKFGINENTPTAELEVQPVGTACTSTIFIHAPQHNTNVASEAILKFGYGHSGSPDGVGHIKMTEQAGNSFDADFIFGLPTNNGSGGSTTNERLRILSSGEVRIPTGSNSTSRLTFGGGIDIYHDGNMKFENTTGYLKLQSSNNLYIDGDEIFLRNESGSNRWKIDSGGHFLPGSVGSFNIGSTGAEIGNLYIADSGSLYIGSDQDIRIWHNSGTGNGNISNGSGNLYINATSTHEVGILVKANNSVDLYYDSSTYSTPKLSTTATGITVDGEVVASQDYPNQRPVLDFNFAQEKVLDPRLMFARDGDASYYDEFGLVRIVGRNEPRFDHDPVTRESKGLLMEENRTNLLSYSIPNSSWQVSQATITENAGIAPDGTNTAVLHSDNNTNNQHLMYTTATVSSGANYVITSHLKQPSSNSRRYYSMTIHGLGYVIFDVQNGTVHNSSGTGIQGASITALRNGWYRVMAHYVTNNTTGNIYWLPIGDDGSSVVYTGASTAQGMLVWGCQLEQATFPTSYIPTNGAIKTRYQDTMRMTGDDVANIYNNTEGTMFYEASVTDLTNDNQPIVAFRDQSNPTGNEIAMGYRTGGGSSGNIRTWMRSYVTGSTANSFLSNHGSTGLVAGKPYKHIFGFKKDDAADSYNTGANSGQTTDTNGNLPVADSIDELRFGAYYSSITTYSLESGHIKRFSYWPVRLTNAQLNTYIA